MLIEIEGDNVGEYIVADYDPMNSAMTLLLSSGIPATNLQTGTCHMAIGYRGMLYRVTSLTNGTSLTPATICIEMLTDMGGIDANSVGSDECVWPHRLTLQGELTGKL